ncbi:MAG: zinc-binding dehydrogenase [Anaerolineales bacterium]|uniref:zinc-binding dehydrogenase n=1 Tax=Promineifilum sp. TaxID=2664178 RepID=UPI001E1163CF|nr:zinc-binding dehydrogenase [Anaerolineales bacterium]MCB8935013.1 zinc-binding dehydrogenase [Promineifilum sp.]MCO5181799.1 zinc-binding dehydrogenase [Promineifilum sp.]
MKALVFDRHGDLDNVRLMDRPVPIPGSGEVLVEIHAAALNRLDLWVLEGWPGLHLKLPHIMGSDGAGIIVGVGDGVGRFKQGDRVAINPTICNDPADHFARLGYDNMCDDYALFGEHVDGFYADYAVVPQRNLLALPGPVPFETAAAASLVFVTAWHSLITRGNLRPGESVLIVGAGGGVNTAAIQIAHLVGAGPILVVGSSATKLALAHELGADAVINRHEVDWSREVYQLTNKRGVDVVVDNVGAATFQKSLRALRRGGRLLTVGNSSGPRFEIDNRYLFGKHLTIIGSTMGTTLDYERVMGLVFKGRLRPVIDTVYPLDQGSIALRRLQDGDVIGKLVLRIR